MTTPFFSLFDSLTLLMSPPNINIERREWMPTLGRSLLLDICYLCCKRQPCIGWDNSLDHMSQRSVPFSLSISLDETLWFGGFVKSQGRGRGQHGYSTGNGMREETRGMIWKIPQSDLLVQRICLELVVHLKIVHLISGDDSQ